MATELPSLPVDIVLGREDEEHSRQPIYRSGVQPSIETYLREYELKVAAITPRTSRIRLALSAAQAAKEFRDEQGMKWALEELVNITRGVEW